jgi:DNA-binding response OmpR family regulator
MKNTVVIIDDDNDLRTLMHLSLRNAGFDVASYSDGNSALKGESRADVYVIDINLGGVSGLDICTKIKSGNPEKTIVVIMVSANPDLRSLAMGACADDVLAKPFISKDLVRKVTEHLNFPPETNAYESKAS